MEKEKNKKIFGTEITNIGTAYTLEEFISLVKSLQNNTNGSTLFYRGETRDYGRTALHPQLFRNPNWIENEHKMLHDYVAKFHNEFPKGTSTFDIMVYADHYGLPVRLLDISSSAFTGLFMACYNYKGQVETSPENDALVYIFKVKTENIKHWNSDCVTLISNVACMPSNFLTNDKGEYKNLSEEEWVYWMGKLMHIIKNEQPDFYYMYKDTNMSGYKTDFDRIVCVESKMINSRIINQKGLFFLFGINGKKTDFENMHFDNLHFDEKVEIFSIKIAGKSKPSILKQLAICGYDTMTMFPDMENVCDAIKGNYGSTKKPINIKYLVKELNREFTIETISFEDTIAFIYYKNYVIIINKKHKIIIKQGASTFGKNGKTTFTFQIDDCDTDSKNNSVISLTRDNTQNDSMPLNFCDGDELVSFDLSSDDTKSIDTIFNANKKTKCPDDLKDILSKLLDIYKSMH